MASAELELSDVALEEAEEDSDSEAEEQDVIMRERTLKDVILGNQLPPKLLAIAIVAFLVSFETFIFFSGFILDKYYSICFSIPYLLVPAFWGWLFFLSRPSFRPTASLQRVLQSLMLGYFSDTLVYLTQWFAVYGILIIVSQIYSALNHNVTVLVVAAVWETLFTSIFLEAIPEELLKYAIIRHISTLEPLPSRYGTVVYAIYGTLGFIFFSGTLRILRIYWMSGAYEAMVYFTIESVLTSTMQIVTGLWIGLNFVKQKFREPAKSPFPTWRVVIPSIVFHAVFMSFISLMYLLYYWGDLNWKLFVFICILMFLVLLLALFLSYRRVKNLFVDPNFYALLNVDDEPADIDSDEEI